MEKMGRTSKHTEACAKGVLYPLSSSIWLRMPLITFLGRLKKKGTSKAAREKFWEFPEIKFDRNFYG